MSAADLTGRRYVITGANTGIGRATAEQLAARGAEVVLACRSLSRAEPVLEAIQRGGGSATAVELDLGRLDSVREAAPRLAERRFDALINNAGIGGTRGVTEDGFELHFGVNYLGHYLLTRLLMPRLREDGARVVHVTSGSYRNARSLDMSLARGRTRGLLGLAEYGHSKLCTMLFHHELARRGVRSLAADPGDVASDGWRHMPWPIRAIWTCRMKSPTEGARTSVFCATADGLAPGGSFVDARADAPSEASLDPQAAALLYKVSAQLTGLPEGDRRDPDPVRSASRAQCAPAMSPSK